MSDAWYDFWVTQGAGYSNGVNLRPTTYSYEEVAKYIVEKTNLKSTDSLLDVGCGNGQMLGQLVPYTKFLSGVDYSANMSALTANLMKLNKVTGEYYQLSADNLDTFKDNSFDKVICFAVMQYFSDLVKARVAVEEMVRVCKTGGLVLIADIIDARSFKKYVSGMYAYDPEELFHDFNYQEFKSYYEPMKRFDVLIKK